MMRLRAFGAALLIGFAAIAPAGAAQFSPDQTTEIRSIIKSYLMEHPEVLRDAITALDEKEKSAEETSRKKVLADMGGPIYQSPDSFVIGNPKGTVTLVEFFDYNCGYCRRALDDLDRLMKENKDLKVILRDFPILSPNSVQAAIIAGAAHQQFPGEKFWDFHRKLLGSKGMVGKDQAVDVARDLGANMDQLAKDAAKPEIRAAIQGSNEIAKSLSLDGTPSYIIGDGVLVGAVGFDELNTKIGNVRKCGKVMCS
jgi:protein-disulfide isomerase